MARSVELIRSDIPKKHIEIDFQQLQHSVESGENFAKLFGVTTISNPSQVNLDYKYALTGVAQQLGFRTWHKAYDLISALRSQTGFDMKAKDNKYHIAIKMGHASDQKGHRYTDAAVDLLRKVLKGEEYQIDYETVDIEKASEWHPILNNHFITIRIQKKEKSLKLPITDMHSATSLSDRQPIIAFSCSH